jgi:arsenate reductase
MMLKTSNVSAKSFFLNASKNVTITGDRKQLLLKIAEAIAKEYVKEELVNLNFICTHNSRRSQLCQVWSFFAADFFNFNINTFSGGIEVTAFHRNTIKTLQKTGFTFQLEDFCHQNPTYRIGFNGVNKTVLGFSKLYNDESNLNPFMAITTCIDADINCPVVNGASYRFHLPFIDPKSSDGKNTQEEMYLNVNKDIAGQIYFLFASVKKIIS